MTDLSAILPESHYQRLLWFAANTGVHSGWPNPFSESELPVLTKAKGIYKPKGSSHALSIRVTPSNYSNTGPNFFPDGSWKLLYHEERRHTGGDPTQHATNKGLLQCLQDSVPVAVVKQISTPQENLYQILGLGIVTDYSDGFFVIEGPTGDAGETQKISVARDKELGPEDVSDDDRQRAIAEIVKRRGQGKFRRDLLQAYNRRCAVTGCDVLHLLDAAHILPHKGSASNKVQNGILLRTDIHTLFDLGLLKIMPETFTVHLEESLLVSAHYRELHGTAIELPSNPLDLPSSALLKAKFV